MLTISRFNVGFILHVIIIVGVLIQHIQHGLVLLSLCFGFGALVLCFDLVFGFVLWVWCFVFELFFLFGASFLALLFRSVLMRSQTPTPTQTLTNQNSCSQC